MNSTLCDLVTAFVEDPKRLVPQIRGHQGEILAHIDSCDACTAAMDSARDVEGIFAALAGESEGLGAEQSAALDRLVKGDTSLEEEVRVVVSDVLLPWLEPPTLALVKGLDPLKIYQATEAVSLLIHRCVTLGEPGTALIELEPDGAIVLDDKEAVSGHGVATEIARFTDLWSPAEPGHRRVPTAEAQHLARWIYLAIQEQRHLLRDFRALPRLLPGYKRVILQALSREERVDDPYERWKLEQGALDRLFISFTTTPAAGPDDTYAILEMEPAQGATPSDLAAVVRNFSLNKRACVFVAPRLASKIRGNPSQPLVRLMRNAKGCHLSFQGSFRALTFKAGALKFRDHARTLTTRAERVDLPWERLGR
jgi:hypothetical protein